MTWHIAVPGCRAKGKGETFRISKTTLPLLPGCMNPLLRWIRSPTRAKRDLPSMRPLKLEGSVMFSSVTP